MKIFNQLLIIIVVLLCLNLSLQANFVISQALAETKITHEKELKPKVPISGFLSVDESESFISEEELENLDNSDNYGMLGFN